MIHIQDNEKVMTSTFIGNNLIVIVISKDGSQTQKEAAYAAVDLIYRQNFVD